MQEHEGPRPHVCRRLFADESESVDPGENDNIINQINEEINRSLDDACKKYNFDFRSDVPLDGDWVWERVSPSGDPPSEESTQPKDLQTNVPRNQPEERQDQPAVLQDQPGVDLDHSPTK